MASVWSPDGSSVAVATGLGSERREIILMPGGGTGEIQSLLRSDDLVIPKDWSRDGKFLLFDKVAPDGDVELWATSLEEGGEPFLVAGSGRSDSRGQFSPDGRWVAYDSDERGQ